MRTWLILIGGMLIWFFHFLGSYIIASVLPGVDLALWLVLALTGASLVATAGLILGPGLRLLRSRDALTRWIGGLAVSGSLLAAVGMTYQIFTVFLA